MVYVLNYFLRETVKPNDEHRANRTKRLRIQTKTKLQNQQASHTEQRSRRTRAKTQNTDEQNQT